MQVGEINNPPTTTVPPSGDDGNGRIKISPATLAKMTAKEILEGYQNQNWDVPENILTWAQQEVQTNPDSTLTWGEASKNGEGNQEMDATQYAATLQEEGMSLKDICKEFTKLSAEKEARDLGNVTKMAPFAQEIPSDESGGDNEESAVLGVLNEISKEMNDSVKRVGPFQVRSKDYYEGIAFFEAFKQGKQDEVSEYEFSLEEIQSVLNGTIADAKDSKQYGEKTVELGKELKSHTKWWQFFGSRRKAAKHAIEQGDKTVKMSERTSKLANAIAKDNDVALSSIEENLTIIDGTNIDGGEGDNGETGGGDGAGSTPTAPPSGPTE